MMRRVYVFIILGCIYTLNAEAKKIEGKILFQNDTIDVTFNIPFKFFGREPNYEKLQNKVKYYDPKGKIIVLRPHQAKEIRFNFEGEEVRMLSRFNTLGFGTLFPTSDHIFLKIELDGNLKLFSYYYTQHSAGMYNGASGTMSMGYSYGAGGYILQKGDEELKRPAGLSFKKDMIEYFNDCPILAQKIENKEFRKNDLEFIVKFYNSNCK